MTIVSHKHKFIFLKSRKTAGSSVEGWLIPQLGRLDIVATSEENRRPGLPLFGTSHTISRFPRIERRAKKLLRRFRPALRLDEHSNALDVRRRVGDRVWNEYFKFSIERQPWDRLISLWSWRRHRLGKEISFDNFLDMIENNGDDPLVEFWSNLPFYTDSNGVIIVDRVLDYAKLRSDLSEAAQYIGLSISIDDLPRHKVGHRTSNETVASLSKAQMQRVGRLCHAEIELFGWEYPSMESRVRNREV